MKTHKLILLKDGRNILVNYKAEEGIHPEVTYFDNKVDKNNIYRGIEFGTENIILNYVKGIKDNFRTVYKIIAGIEDLPTLTYTDLGRANFLMHTIYRMIVPKGAKYFLSNNGEIVSDQLVFPLDEDFNYWDAKIL